MAILTNLFGESPFGTLEAHGEKVHECVRLLRPLFEQLAEGDLARLRATADTIFRLESEADEIRNHLHEMLVSSVLMPVPKSELFNILEQQDSMADRAEDVANTLTLRPLKPSGDLMGDLSSYLDMILKNCELAAGIMSKLDLLVESSFTGRDALTVSRLITELANREDEVKPIEIALSRKMMAAGDSIPPVETILWLRVIQHLADLSKFADHTARGIRLTLKLKS